MQYVQIGKCTLCDKPAVGAINANANAGGTVAPKWEPRCDEHNPYWNPQPYALRAAAQQLLDQISDENREGAYFTVEFLQKARALEDALKAGSK